MLQFPRGFKDLEKTVLKVFTTIASQETNKHKTIRDLTFCTIYILIILTVKTHMKRNFQDTKRHENLDMKSCH